MYGNPMARLLAAGFWLIAANAFAADSIHIAHTEPPRGPFRVQ